MDTKNSSDIDALVEDIRSLANSGYEIAHHVSSRRCVNEREAGNNVSGYEIAIKGEFYTVEEILDRVRQDSTFVADEIGHVSSQDSEEGAFIIFVTDVPNARGYLSTGEYEKT